jgi:hypothetical protein
METIRHLAKVRVSSGRRHFQADENVKDHVEKESLKMRGEKFAFVIRNPKQTGSTTKVDGLPSKSDWKEGLFALRQTMARGSQNSFQASRIQEKIFELEIFWSLIFCRLL